METTREGESSALPSGERGPSLPADAAVSLAPPAENRDDAQAPAVAELESRGALPIPPAPPPPPQPELPVDLTVPHPPRLSRILVPVKWAASIPWWFFLALYAAAAEVVGLIGIVATLLTGKYPRGLFEFYRRFLERQFKVAAYFPLLMSDRWSGAGISLRVDYPARLSRLLLIARLFVSTFVSILVFGSQLGAVLVSVPAWPAILVTGRYPRGLFNTNLELLRWQARLMAWVGNLRDDRSANDVRTPVCPLFQRLPQPPQVSSASCCTGDDTV